MEKLKFCLGFWDLTFRETFMMLHRRNCYYSLKKANLQSPCISKSDTWISTRYQLPKKFGYKELFHKFSTSTPPITPQTTIPKTEIEVFLAPSNKRSQLRVAGAFAGIQWFMFALWADIGFEFMRVNQLGVVEFSA